MLAVPIGNAIATKATEAATGAISSAAAKALPGPVAGLAAGALGKEATKAVTNLIPTPKGKK
jgi:hypothetical protein